MLKFLKALFHHRLPSGFVAFIFLAIPLVPSPSYGMPGIENGLFGFSEGAYRLQPLNQTKRIAKEEDSETQTHFKKVKHALPEATQNQGAQLGLPGGSQSLFVGRRACKIFINPTF
jgi:hypothetical protein